MREKVINIKIKVIREGQERPYADSKYEYEIETEDMNDFDVQKFCTKVLKPCSQARSEWNQGFSDSFFKGYYTFEKLGKNKYRYFVLKPSTC